VHARAFPSQWHHQLASFNPFLRKRKRGTDLVSYSDLTDQAGTSSRLAVHGTEGRIEKCINLRSPISIVLTHYRGNNPHQSSEGKSQTSRAPKRAFKLPRPDLFIELLKPTAPSTDTTKEGNAKHGK
jgi:hypothetical protein